MSESIAFGQSVDLPVRAGHSLKVGYLGGTYSAVATAGLSGLPSALATNATTSQTLGPWARNIVVRLSTSSNGRVEYAVGNPPVFAPTGNSFVRTSDGVPVELKGLGANAEYLAAGSNPTAPASLAASGSYSTSLTEGARYESAAPTVTGGVPPYAFGSAGGALPYGIRINPETGVLHGVPSFQGTFGGIKVRVTDQGGSTPIDITVGAITVAAPSGGGALGVRTVVVGDSLTQRTWDSAPGGATLTASGGVATLTLATARENLLPGTPIRIVNSGLPDSFFAGEWTVATKPSGTSITFNYAGGATATAEGNWTIAYGNAVASESYVNHIQAKLRQRLNIVKNLGVDGEVTAQILSRMQTKVTPNTPDIIVMLGGTNDFNTAVPLATTTANWYAMLDLAVTQAQFVIAICPGPRSTASPDPGTLAGQIKAYAAANYPTSRLQIVDAYELVAVGGGTTTPKAGYLIDGVHWSPNAARDVGLAVAAVLDAKIPSMPAVPSGSNFVPNGNFAAVTGNTADGVTFVNAASHTNTPSIVAEPAGNGNLQRLQVVATSTAGTSRIVVNSIHAALTPGDRYRLWARARIESTTGALPVFNTDLNIVAGGQTYNQRALTTATGSAMGGTQQAYQGTLDAYVRSEVFVCPASITECSPRLTIGTSGAGTSVVSFGEIFVERVV